MSEINTINIHWSGLFDSISGLKTDVQNRLQIKREIIPLIFIPGIMGSRLKIAKGEDTGDKAWDPDDGGFMLDKFGYAWISAAERKALLVGAKFNKDYLDVDNKNSKHNRKFTKQDPTREKRGWGGVFWKSYGTFLRELERHRWPEPISHCFEFPVHAFGYNWTASNHDEIGRAHV